MLETLISFFDGLEQQPLLRLLLIVIPLLLLWFVESGFPLVRLKYRNTKISHAALNLGFTLAHLVVHSLLAVFLVAVSDWCQHNDFGLVNWLNLSPWPIIFVGILGMEFFGGWLVHWVEHQVPFFWRMHIVHHADNKVDVTTGLRHHPFEALNRWVFFTSAVFVLGLPVYAILLAQTFMSMFTMFTHANISLPPKLDKALSWVFVSPNMHKVHHHYKQPYTDSNYGTALSIFDRIFGTYRYLPPQDIRYGLDHYYDNSRDEEFRTLLRSPFENTAPPRDTEPSESLSPVMHPGA